MKKILPLLLGGLTLVAFSIGLFMSQPVSVVEAKDTVLEVDSKDTIQFGSFAANYDKSLSDELNASGRATFISNNNIQDTAKYIEGDDVFTFKGERFLMKNVHLTNAPDNVSMYNKEVYPKDEIDNKMGVFKFMPIEWSLLSEDNGYTNYISKQIILREKFYVQDGDDIRYYSSHIKEVLNDNFLTNAFSETEKGYLVKKDLGNNVKDYVDLPTKSQIGENQDGKGPTDYVICSGLDLSENQGSYLYWTKDPNQNDPTHVITMAGVTDPSNDTVGVRPIIRLKVKVKGSGGGTVTPSGPIFNVNFNGNIPLMIVGFIFLAGGLVFLVIFVIKWSKRIRVNPKFRHPWWYYLLIGISITVTIIGCSLFSYGTILEFGIPGLQTQKATIYGLYISGTYLDDDANSEDWDWAGITHGIYALSKDGKVYHYIGNFPVGKEIIREDGEGSYVLKGNEVTITFPETWRTFTFEHSPITYKVEFGKNLEVKFYLDYEVQFATSVVPFVSGSGLYNKNMATAFSDHNPDGRPYYNIREIGLG